MFTNKYGFLPFFAVCMMAMFLLTSPAMAVDVGVSFNQIGEDVSWGGNVEIPFSISAIGGEIDTTVQGGDLIRARYHGELSFQAGLKWKVFADGYAKGTTFGTMGRTTDFGIGIRSRCRSAYG